MFEKEKNLKDSSISQGLTLKDTSISVSYNKTNKLITALFMVTDILEKEEPLRTRLRSLGVAVISDIYSNPKGASLKVKEIMSLLGIARSLEMISEMNFGILAQEFKTLDQSLREAFGEATQGRVISLENFFNTEDEAPLIEQGKSKGHDYIGHTTTFKTNVQKNAPTPRLSNTMSDRPNKPDFDILKKQRRDNLLVIIKILGGNATITDIKNKIKVTPEQARFLIDCSEKTLQRELVSMVKDGVLTKTGEKRWSRYSLKG